MIKSKIVSPPSSPENIFLRIGNPEEIEKIIVDLIQSRRDILAKSETPMSDIFQFRPHDWINHTLVCVFRSSKDQLMWDKLFRTSKAKQRFVIQFYLGEEKYFTQVLCEESGGYVHMDLNVPLFRLQRRESFRVRLPARYNMHFLFTHQGQTHRTRVVDISSGGLKLETFSIEGQLQIGDSLSGILQLTDQETIHLRAKIRHSQPHPENRMLSWVGCQFFGMNEKDQSRVTSLVMDVYRDLFARLK